MARQSLKSCLRLLDQINKETPVNEQFIGDLKRSIELTDSKNKREPSKTYKPSSMNCMRQSYYTITGAERDTEDVNYQLVGICNSGTDIHVRIQTAVDEMKENNIDCEYVNVAEYIKARELPDIEIVSQQGMETKLYHQKYNMSYMCDGIVKYKGKYYILEIKTEASFKFMSRQDVDPSHYNQAIAYGSTLGIRKVLFVYINRDTLDMKCYTYDVTAQDTKKFEKYINICNNYIDKQTPPPIPENVTKKTCSYCPYKTICKKEV